MQSPLLWMLADYNALHLDAVRQLSVADAVKGFEIIVQRIGAR